MVRLNYVILIIVLRSGVLRRIKMLSDVTFCEENLFLLRKAVGEVLSDVCYGLSIRIFIVDETFAQVGSCLHGT